MYSTTRGENLTAMFTLDLLHNDTIHSHKYNYLDTVLLQHLPKM